MPNHFSRIGTAALALCLAALACAPFAAAQSTPPPATTAPPSATPKLHTDTTVTVRAEISPDSKENDDLMKVFSAAVPFGEDPNCAATIDALRATLIPQAQRAKFAHNKAMYLGMADAVTAHCQMQKHQYAEAEQTYRDQIAQHDLWPDTKDSLNAETWYALSQAQLKQSHWKDAEVSAAKAAALLETLITADTKHTAGADTEPVAAVEKMGRLRAEALGSVAYAQMKDGRADEAAKTISLAYQQAVDSNLTGMMRANIVSQGKNIASITGDAAEQTKWSARFDAEVVPLLKQLSPAKPSQPDAAPQSSPAADPRGAPKN
jgi:hypothetical protein